MKLFNLLRVSWKGVRKVAKVQAIKTLEDAIEAGLGHEDISKLQKEGLEPKAIINNFKHNLVHEYLYPFAEKYGYEAADLDIVIPALKVFYKWLRQAYYGQKKFQGGN